MENSGIYNLKDIYFVIDSIIPILERFIYILGKSVYTLKNILELKREGWETTPIIVNILFVAIYLLFLDKLLFIEPSMNIISNFKDFCQWYLKIYILGIILLGFWLLEPFY